MGLAKLVTDQHHPDSIPVYHRGFCVHCLFVNAGKFGNNPEGFLAYVKEQVCPTMTLQKQAFPYGGAMLHL
jgi:hypothetical protein